MKYVKSPINYNGNKYKIIGCLVDLFPNNINTFVDLFGGSGVISLNANAEHIVYNDIIPYICEILDGIKSINDIDVFIKDNIYNIIKEYNLNKVNLNGFEKLRKDYNTGMKNWNILYLLMCYSFNNQFRFNSKHEYNSSFGKNKSCFGNITEQKLRISKQKLDSIDIIFTHKDFSEFDFTDFDENDFVYLDPPYYGSIGNYNDGKRGFKGWNLELETKMRELCEKLDKQGVRFGLSNNLSVNITLYDWVKQNGFKITEMNAAYYNSNYHKKNKQKNIDREVYIYNY